MSFRDILLLILSGVFVNNYALTRFIGVSHVLGFSGQTGKAAGMGLAVAFVLQLVSIITWPVQVFVLDKLGIEYMQTLIFVAIILVVVYLVDRIFSKAAGNDEGSFFPLIALNAAVLAAAVDNVSGGYGFLQAQLAALGVGLGFLLAMLLFSGLRCRIDYAHVPKSFQGLPINLLTAAIVAMALGAFI